MRSCPDTDIEPFTFRVTKKDFIHTIHGLAYHQTMAFRYRLKERLNNPPKRLIYCQKRLTNSLIKGLNEEA